LNETNKVTLAGGYIPHW